VRFQVNERPPPEKAFESSFPQQQPQTFYPNDKTFYVNSQQQNQQAQNNTQYGTTGNR